MRYNSIGEYFYRLSNRCLAYALLPLMIIWGLYFANQNFFSGSPWLPVEDKAAFLFLGIIVGILAILYWCQQLMLLKRLKRLHVEPGLGNRMKEYIIVVVIRFRSFSLMLLVIGFGAFLSGRLTCLYLLPIPLLCFVFYWPTRIRISKDLKLKEEEQAIMKNSSLGA